jgi:hypothetical protein
LDDGKIYRKPLYLMVKTMVSCRFSLKPIHWIIFLGEHLIFWVAVGICWHCFGRKQLEIPYVICGVSSRFGCRETHLQGPKNGKMWETKVTRGKSFSDLFGNSVVFVTRRTSWFQVDFKNQLHIFRSWSRRTREAETSHCAELETRLVFVDLRFVGD